MVQRATPQQLFGMLIDENTWITVGIIVLGIVACVACVTIVYSKRG